MSLKGILSSGCFRIPPVGFVSRVPFELSLVVTYWNGAVVHLPQGKPCLALKLSDFVLINSVVYIGDSASLSFLQWIRMIVENVSGPSDFTQDPRRHMIMENAICLPHDLRPTGVLPDQRTAMILIDSFFTNVRFPPYT
jgi:hypothetical protein